MLDWFEKLITETFWKTIDDAFSGFAVKTEQAIVKALRELTAGKQLSSSPLIVVLEVDNLADTVTLLLRGNMPIGDSVTPFMRVEAVILRSDVHLDLDPPLRVREWRTVLGDLAIGTKNKAGKSIFEGNLGFGYDKGALMGQGLLKIGPVPFRIGTAIGGALSDRGMVLDLDAELPRGAAIPLGPTGLGLRGFGGDFAHNFVARLENPSTGTPIPNPTAKDYVAWARDGNSLDRWKPGPLDKTAVGVGVRAVLCTMFDQGFAFELNPIGFAFLTPGGAILLGGKGVLLRQGNFGVEGYFVIDVASASLAFGLGVNVEIKAPPEQIAGELSTTVLKGAAQLDGFFSFSDPSAWFLDVGSESKPAFLEVGEDFPIVLRMLFTTRAEAYLQINQHRIAFGAGMSLGGTFRVGDALELTARLGATLHAYIGWDPMLIRGKLDVVGELAIKIWEFKFSLTGHATPIIYMPDPLLFSFELSYKLDLPWPLPDPEDKVTLGDQNATPPTLTSPLLAGTAVSGGTTTVLPQKIVATHALSDRQWMPDAEKLWPDATLVVPFSRRATDTTGKAAGLVATVSIPGSYEVKDELTKLELWDLVKDQEVQGVNAVWADGPDGATSLLQVLGLDPFSWLTPHTDAASSSSSPPRRTLEVFFGDGPREDVPAPRRFDDLTVAPLPGGAALLPWFTPNVHKRVLQSRGYALTFHNAATGGAAVDWVSLFIIGNPDYDALLVDPVPATIDYVDFGPTVGAAKLVAAVLRFATPVDRVEVRANMDQFLTYSIRYEEVAVRQTKTAIKRLLKPGRYRLTVEGKSTASHPESAAHPTVYPPVPQMDWRAVQEFEVAYPETLRSHIFYATFGDTRLFAKHQSPWSTWSAPAFDWTPGLFGFGFPLYRQYHLAVRFLAPYVDEMFDKAPLKLRLAYEGGGEVKKALTPVPVTDGTSSMLSQTQAWFAAMGTKAPPDQEIVLGAPFSKGGTARLSLYFDHPTLGEVLLDDWTGVVSRFNTFREHTAWSGGCVTRRYNAAGRHESPACAPLGAPLQISHPHFQDLAGIEPFVAPSQLSGALTGPLATEVVGGGASGAFPPELKEPPLDWRLAAALASELGALDSTAGLRFTRFAALTGAHLGELGYGVEATSIEAITDERDRPYALWLRTPEPLDWRRVQATLKVSHVEPNEGCPARYAHRAPLSLAVKVLPSPDASSALLVGTLAGIPLLLPRGEVELRLTYDPTQAGLPKLRPSPSVGATPEVQVLRFVQPFGRPWPQPGSGVVVPNDLLDMLLKSSNLPVAVLIQAYEQNLRADQVEELLRRHRREHPDEVKEGPP